MSDNTTGSSDDINAQIRQRTIEQLPAFNACVICLDQINEPCEASPCHHTNFDYLCLLEWLSRTPRCPLCVQPVASVKHQVDGKDVETSVNTLSKAPQKPPASSTPSQNDLFLNPYRLRDAQRRNRPRRPPRSCAQPAADLGIQGRKRIYQRGLYSKHVGTNRMSKYRELSPALFNNDTQLVSRARMFLRRELQVFPFLTGESQPDTDPSLTSARRRRADNAEFLLEYIVAVLKSVDILGGRAEDLVSEFLGREHTRLFLHELRAWLRSPYERLEDWDRMVQYAEPSESSVTASSMSGTATQRPVREWQRPRGDSWRPSVRDRRKWERQRRDEERPSARPGR